MVTVSHIVQEELIDAQAVNNVLSVKLLDPFCTNKNIYPNWGNNLTQVVAPSLIHITTTAAGKMVFRMLAVLNEFERDQISERTSAILQHKKAKGEVYSPIPYGLKREGKKLVADKKEQRVISLIMNQRHESISLREIARQLNNAGIPSKRGGCWYASTVRYILANDIHSEGLH